MPILRAIRTLNSLESGALTGSALQTQLADAGRLGDFVSLLTQRGYSRRLAASSTAMAAVAASSTAMAAVFGSSAARMAIYDHATALATITADASAQAYLKTIDTQVSTTSTSHVSANLGRTLLVTQWGSSGGASYAGASADTYSTTSTAPVDRFAKVTNLTHRTSGVSYPSYVTYIDMD